MSQKMETVHLCVECKSKFPGTGKRGRPFKRCPKCRTSKKPKK